MGSMTLGLHTLDFKQEKWEYLMTTELEMKLASGANCNTFQYWTIIVLLKGVDKKRKHGSTLKANGAIHRVKYNTL